MRLSNQRKALKRNTQIAVSGQSGTEAKVQAMFGGAIAVVLLGIYVYLLRFAYVIVDCAATAGCKSPVAGDFNDVMAQTLTVIGGLVSALVIAELAITRPGTPPVGRVLAADATPRTKSVLRIVTITYVLVWLVAGLVAFTKGMYHPKVLPPFTSVGQAWLGLAVAAAYAYFGIQPQQQQQPRPQQQQQQQPQQQQPQQQQPQQQQPQH